MTFEEWWVNAIGLYERKELARHAWDAASKQELTDYQREAIEAALDAIGDGANFNAQAILRNLLAKS